MLFNSYIFILLFLPLCIIGYFILNHFKKYTLAQFYLLAMSLWFYGYNNINYLWILIISILFNYGVYCALGKLPGKKVRKALATVGVSVNILILFWFKYIDFFFANTNALFGTDIPFLNIVMPLGISFFTFQQISFVIDAYRKEIPQYSFVHYASFVSYFPQLIAGPIVSHDELVPQFIDRNKKTLNYTNLSKGLYIFTLGMSKKVLLADTLGKIVSYGYSISPESLTSVSALILILAYTLQIYFDFSGYCDMAIGLGKMMNIDLPQNFNSPYKAQSITEFWDRWHMTLTRFFTKYVYIPLGGNRKGLFRTCLHIMVVFTLSGFWHGASWSFVLWGILHGLFSVITRVFGKFFAKIPTAINWFITFLFVNVTWVLFRANSLGQAFGILKRAFAFDFSGIDTSYYTLVESVEFVELLDIFSIRTICPPALLIGYFLVAFFLLFAGKNAYEKMCAFKPTLLKMLTTIILFIWCLFSLAGITTFLYFNF